MTILISHSCLMSRDFVNCCFTICLCSSHSLLSISTSLSLGRNMHLFNAILREIFFLWKLRGTSCNRNTHFSGCNVCCTLFLLPSCCPAFVCRQHHHHPCYHHHQFAFCLADWDFWRNFDPHREKERMWEWLIDSLPFSCCVLQKGTQFAWSISQPPQKLMTRTDFSLLDWVKGKNRDEQQ